eukprot:TRINITY_DN7813_c0_g1_i1.p1 TRINITY_DN7813_c0_g1~~TRINITY_DN7813_c0_g1_i1.p1  ORF type:complete len:147 (+),score=11.74 TRINITY_DN7813_c0_g1_i1:132-572(+)
MKVSVYNPLSLATPFRLHHIANRLRSDIVLLPGTRWKTPPDSMHAVVQLTSQYWAMSFGWRRGSFTNGAAGCAIVFRKALFNHRKVTSVLTPPFSLAGRGALSGSKSKLETSQWEYSAVHQWLARRVCEQLRSKATPYSTSGLKRC